MIDFIGMELKEPENVHFQVYVLKGFLRTQGDQIERQSPGGTSGAPFVHDARKERNLTQSKERKSNPAAPATGWRGTR
jgi:hypothetical protein